MAYTPFTGTDPSVPPTPVVLLGSFFALSIGASLVLLVYVLVNTLGLGYWTIAAVAAVGIVVALGLLYLGISHTLAAFGSGEGGDGG